MKTLFTFLTCIVFIPIIHAQDKIVTTDGEILECKILNISDSHIHYNYLTCEKTQEFAIPTNLVTCYKESTSKHKFEPVSSHSPITYPYRKLSLNAGPGYRFGKAQAGQTPEFYQQIKKLRHGYHVGADFDFFINESVGFGFKYSRFRSTASIDNMNQTDEKGTTLSGPAKDDITISYVGPSLSTSLIFRPSNTLLKAGFSCGLIQYKNRSEFIETYLFKGFNMGFALDVGLDKRFSKNLEAGVKLSFVGGYLTQVGIKKGDGSMETYYLNDDYYEDLSHLNLSLGLRFR